MNKAQKKKAFQLAAECLKEIGMTRPFHLLPYSYRCRVCGKVINCLELPIEEEKICTTCCLRS